MKVISGEGRAINNAECTFLNAYILESQGCSISSRVLAGIGKIPINFHQSTKNLTCEFR